jgi:hypothetical protein
MEAILKRSRAIMAAGPMGPLGQRDEKVLQKCNETAATEINAVLTDEERRYCGFAGGPSSTGWPLALTDAHHLRYCADTSHVTSRPDGPETTDPWRLPCLY